MSYTTKHHCSGLPSACHHLLPRRHAPILRRYNFFTTTAQRRVVLHLLFHRPVCRLFRVASWTLAARRDASFEVGEASDGSVAHLEARHEPECLGLLPRPGALNIGAHFDTQSLFTFLLTLSRRRKPTWRPWSNAALIASHRLSRRLPV